MSETPKKRIKFNEDILLILQNRYGYSIDYIRKSLRGDRNGIMPDALKKEYKKLVNASKQAIQKKSEELDS